MKSRYNLRIQPTKLILPTTNKKTPSISSSSRVTKKSKPSHTNPIINEQTRRHSLRLTPTVKKPKSRTTIHETIPKWRKVENDSDDESSSTSSNNDDDYDDLLERHQRLMLEEQKDRKLYERYIRDQRILRRLQCRRTHTAHLKESTRNRLLRELERERRDAIHDKICAYLSNRTIIFRHGYTKESKKSMNWSTLEEEVPHNRNIGTIHELDVMIGNLKKVLRNSKSSISKPRLSVRERQKQRLATVTSVTPTKSDHSQITEIHSSPIISNPTINTPSQLSIISYSPRVPLVRFNDDPNIKVRASNSQRLTCIQNVLSHHNNHQTRLATNEISTPIGIRKSFLRPKSPHINLSDSSSTKKRPLEKENCSVPTNSSSNNSHSDIVLKTISPMVSIKHTTSSSSSRSYPNTRKHLMINNSLTTRRQTRLSLDLLMIELPDLFHENRVPELTLSLILYTPIGLCLVLIRSIVLLFLFLISSILPASSFLDQFLNEVISLILTFTYVDETIRNGGDDKRRRTKIIVGNRVSLLDIIVLRRFISNNKCKVVNLWKENSWINWFKLNTINSSRIQEDLLDVCVNEIQHSDVQLIFLPECEPTTGSNGLLKFNLLPFTLAQKLQLPILPVYLRTSRAFQIRTSIFNGHPFADLFWFLFSPYTQYHIIFLPIVAPIDSSSSELFCEQVRETMTKTMGIELTQFDEREVAELKKRPDLVQRRHAQRRAEFQQMIELVHQQVPLASLEAIRYDLETTKNVQRTIANLNERVAAAVRAANKVTSSSTTSSSAIKSSGGNGHRQTYERLKYELIEKNRQLFLNKNSN